MTRILYVVTVPLTLRAFLLPYGTELRRRGYRVDAAANGVESCSHCKSAFNNVYNVCWSRNPFNLLNILTATRQLQRIVAAQEYDIVHVHTPVAGFLTRWALNRLRITLGVKVIYTAHGFHFHPLGPALTNALYLLLEKFAGRWTDYLVVINREDERMAQKHRIVDPSRLRYMPGIGVDWEALAPERISAEQVGAVRAELQLTDPSLRLFLMIAEFNSGKRHRDVLEAFAQLPTRHCHLALAGTGPMVAAMRARAKRLGIDRRVHFLGFRTDIPVLIRAACATLLPSEREGLPRSVMESLCLATPVVASNIRGTADLLTADCGLLVRVGDVPGYSAAMDWVLKHDQEAASMGRRGRDRMIAFDLKGVLDLHCQLYGDATQPHNPRCSS